MMPNQNHFVTESALWERIDSPLPKVLASIRSVVIAVLASAAGIDIRYGFDSVLGSHVPFLISSLAVLAASFFGGPMSGLLALALSTAVDTFLFVSPRYNLMLSGWRNDSQIAIFFVVGVALAVLGSRLRKKLKPVRSSD